MEIELLKEKNPGCEGCGSGYLNQVENKCLLGCVIYVYACSNCGAVFKEKETKK